MCSSDNHKVDLPHQFADQGEPQSGGLRSDSRCMPLIPAELILAGIPDGVVLLDSDNNIVWANERFRQWTHHEKIENEGFYKALGNPEILGPDFCPFHTALATGEPSNSTLHAGENLYLHVHAALITQALSEAEANLVVTIRDVTAEVLQQQKMAAIHQAGVELADLKPEEVFEMGVEDRVELLKDNIRHYTRNLLNFDVIEIRLLDPATGTLEPLICDGFSDDASQRALRARSKENGVTGFVAATGKSYLCENTEEDPLYLPGVAGAKSSLTVPLVLHEQVIGTFNVESPEAQAFTESDLQFLEIFSRDVAVALNTLELLVAQQANAAQASCYAIHSAVALPVDEILNDAVNVMELYIGHESELVGRLERILRNARDIKQVIHKVGQKMAPALASPASGVHAKHPSLIGKRVLVVDNDEAVRSDAHSLLDRYGCIVETAHEGAEALLMVRTCGEYCYDAIISDIRLPDMNGRQFMILLQETMEKVPLVLMTGFGYDPGHSIVKARQAGLHPNAVLHKPFRRDQLLTAVESVVAT